MKETLPYLGREAGTGQNKGGAVEQKAQGARASAANV